MLDWSTKDSKTAMKTIVAFLLAFLNFHYIGPLADTRSTARFCQVKPLANMQWQLLFASPWNQHAMHGLAGLGGPI